MSGASELQVVEFGLGNEVFAVPVTLVREILDYAAPSHLPNGPPHFVGLTDLRGQGVPTVDLRRRLGLPAAEPTLATRILILDVPLSDRLLTLGVVIDRVLSVTSFEKAEIEPAPDIGIRWNSEYITGVVRRESGFVVIVDAARIFTTEDAIGVGNHGQLVSA
ncbi:chemotaxis protein CheW [Novosphingobium taihuense]|uniref:Purine-binding chemotaxis protein CheW n=1 Tax=Novosphingobium taihuense TaxID=260085 RepID=A0A7W7AAE6_9SPHN|nr:chemotaxis protein CheW [Novosphingobium taihuense]MBB4613390.1 purine-binding chemotaxis protein CheW [Novosphingobium taihuense]TWH80896.1 purine-binding chemotaxis protein CheW [Novosphingobium taihuense]